MDESKRMEVSEETKNEQKTLKGWIGEHKKEIVIAGIGVAALVGIGLGIKNKEAIKAFCTTLNKNNLKVSMKSDAPSIVEKVNSSNTITASLHRDYKKPFDVNTHIRNLHEGWNASPEKLAKAEACGICLLPGQTFVEHYRKGKAA